MENEKWDFFVSFTSTDEQNARWIAAELEAAGYRVLFQHHQFVPGADFAGLMNQGATCARRTLGVLSPAALEKPMVRREWDSSIVADPSGADRKLVLVEVTPTPDLVGVLATTVRIRVAGLALDDARRTLLEGVSAAVTGRRAPQATVPSWLADRVLSARLPVPVAPQWMVERPGMGAALRERIRRGAVVGLVGPGGAGKSTAAQTIAADEHVRRRFDDRVVWLDVGRRPDFAALRDRLAEAFGGRVAGRTEPTSLDELRRLAAHRAHLVVLDDVWDAEHLAGLDVAVGGTACLVTTRNRDVLPWRADVHDVGLVDDATARRILAAWARCAPEDLPAAAAAVVQRCGGLALALAAAGGLVRSGLDWPDIAAKLDAAAELDLRIPDYPYPTLLRALSVGVDNLPPGLRERLRAMVVLQDRGTVPIEVCGLLWDDDEPAARSSLAQLSDRSLVAYDAAAATVGIHDLLLRHLASEINDGLLPAQHLSFAQALLAGLRRAGPPGALARYAARNAVGHLVDAERADLVHDLLVEGAPDDGGPANLWFHVHSRIDGVGGYLGDLDVARALAERTTDEGIARGAPTPGVAHELRYALLRASVTAVASTLPSWVPAQLVRRGLWSPERAVAHAAAMGSDAPDAQAELLEMVDEEERRRLAVAILDSPHVGTSALGGYLGRTIRPHVPDERWKRKVAGLVRDARESQFALNFVHVARLCEEAERIALLREAVATARSELTPDPFGEASALIELAKCVPDGHAVADALRTAWAVEPGTKRAGCLLDLSELVDGWQRRRLLRRARAEALAADTDSGLAVMHRHQVLARLVERSTRRARAGIVRALVDDVCRDPTRASRALRTVAAEADADQFARVTDAVRGIADPANRVDVLDDLAADADGVRREELLLEAVRDAREIVATTPEERERQASLLAHLAARMPDERGDALLRQVLALSGQIGDRAALAPWRAALAVHLPDAAAAVLRATALADARRSGTQLQAIARLLPEPERSRELRGLLDAALAEPRPFDRAVALRDLAPDLPAPLAGRAAAALQALLGIGGAATTGEAVFVARQATAGLLDRLPEGARADLLPVLIEQPDVWTVSLDQLGPTMSFDEMKALLEIAAHSRCNDLDLEKLVAALLPWIPPAVRHALVPDVRAAADAAPPRVRAEMMVGLARAAPGPEGAPFRQAALALAREMTGRSAVPVFIAVARVTDPGGRAAVLAEARSLARKTITSWNPGPAVTVAMAADELLETAWPEHWRPLIRAAADEGRPKLGALAAMTCDAVHRLGGPAAVDAVATALDDVVRWWP